MASKTYKGKQVMAYVSDAQKDVLARFAKQSGMTQAEAIRQALKAYIPDFPDDMLPQGNPQLNKNSEEA